MRAFSQHLLPEKLLFTIHVPVSLSCISNPCDVFLFSGSHTMALLEKLEPGNVYLVKIAASNQVGDGPFSNIVELPLKRGNKNPRHSDNFPHTTGKHHETLETSHVDESDSVVI